MVDREWTLSEVKFISWIEYDQFRPKDSINFLAFYYQAESYKLVSRFGIFQKIINDDSIIRKEHIYSLRVISDVTNDSLVSNSNNAYLYQFFIKQLNTEISSILMGQESYVKDKSKSNKKVLYYENCTELNRIDVLIINSLDIEKGFNQNKIQLNLRHTFQNPELKLLVLNPWQIEQYYKEPDLNSVYLYMYNQSWLSFNGAGTSKMFGINEHEYIGYLDTSAKHAVGKWIFGMVIPLTYATMELIYFGF